MANFENFEDSFGWILEERVFSWIVVFATTTAFWGCVSGIVSYEILGGFPINEAKHGNAMAVGMGIGPISFFAWLATTIGALIGCEAHQNSKESSAFSKTFSIGLFFLGSLLFLGGYLFISVATLLSAILVTLWIACQA